MLKHMLTGALIAGAVAGLMSAALQFAFVIPLLLEGELYETGARVHFGMQSPQSPAGTPALGWDLARHLGTVGFDVIAFVSYGLVITGLMALAAGMGHKVDARKGAVWGLAGFVALMLAPSFGMAPELPGTITAELIPRQIWWASTVLATGLALWLFAFGKGWGMLLLGGVLLHAPQIIGAPHLDLYYGVAAPELASEFAARSLGVGAIGWVVLGSLAGHFYGKPEA